MIFYPLNPEDAPTAAELAEEAASIAAARRAIADCLISDPDGWTLTTEPYDPEDVF